MKAAIIFVLGLLAIAAGMLFALQGAGIVHWPAESSMIGHHEWTEYGIVIVLIGVGLMLTARKIRQG